MISHLFCHIIFNGSESLGPAHIQGEGIIESSEYQEGKVIVDILEAAYLPKDATKVCTLLIATWTTPPSEFSL